MATLTLRRLGSGDNSTFFTLESQCSTRHGGKEDLSLSPGPLLPSDGVHSVGRVPTSRLLLHSKGTAPGLGSCESGDSTVTHWDVVTRLFMLKHRDPIEW